MFCGQEGSAPISVAAVQSSHNCLRMLIEAKADVNIQESNGLSCHIQHQCQCQCQCQCQSQCQCQYRLRLTLTNLCCIAISVGNTPIFSAGQHGRPEIVAMLLGAKADPLIENGKVRFRCQCSVSCQMPNTQMSNAKCSNAQMLECSNAQMLECPNAKCSNAKC